MARPKLNSLDQRLTPKPGDPPEVAGQLAFRRFCTPSLSERRTGDHDILVARSRHYLERARWQTVPTSEGEIQAYIYEPEGEAGASVLVVHGWTSEASFMTVFAEQLRKAGLRAILIDCPAHGKNPRRHASLIDCARAVLEVAEALGPIDFALGHSMGCLGVLLAGRGGAPFGRAHPFRRYVLVAPPDRFGDVVGDFGEGLGLNAGAQRVFERHLERVAHRPMQTFSASNLLAGTGQPALILHATDDSEIGVHNGRQIAASCPKAELQCYEGLGHRKILGAPPVIRAAVQFLTRG